MGLEEEEEEGRGNQTGAESGRWGKAGPTGTLRVWHALMVAASEWQSR